MAGSPLITSSLFLAPRGAGGSVVRAAEDLLAHMDMCACAQLSKALTDRRTWKSITQPPKRTALQLISSVSIPSEVSWGQKVQTLPLGPCQA